MCNNIIFSITWRRTNFFILARAFVDIPTIMTIRVGFIAIRAFTNEIPRYIFAPSIVTAWIESGFAFVCIHTFFVVRIYFKTRVTVTVVAAKSIDTCTCERVLCRY